MMTDKKGKTDKAFKNGQDAATSTGSDAATSKGPVFAMHNIYIRDLSFEAPRAPQVFNEPWKPKVDFDLQMGSQILSEKDHIFDVVLHVTVTVKLPEDQTAYLIEVQQAGIFTVAGFEEDLQKQILATSCPTALFPYVRETIGNAVQRAGFPPLILPPINFDAMYAQHLAKQHEEGTGRKDGKE